jgi:two-component system CheB/CheR fusion protein
VPGCSTGEEAYSLAILLRERMEAMNRSLSVQIFATDLDGRAIETARSGLYPVGIADDVSARRLSRFFSREEDCFRVKKEIREMVVFAPQNLISDPPFTKLDILSCRNLLIYLDNNLQRKVLPILHYSLRRKGILFLGSSESVGAFGELFTPVGKKWKIFRRQEVGPNAYLTDLPSGRPVAVPPPPRAFSVGGEATLMQMAERMLLRDLVPPTVLVTERGDVAHVHGRTGLFLEPAPGPQSSANIFNMAREGLQVSLSAALRQAGTQDHEVVHRGVPVKTNGDRHLVDLHVLRLSAPEGLKGLFRVSFHLVGPVVEGAASAPQEHQHPERLLELERELQYTKESHQGTIEELETANEELKSTNEELQSTNEELQSANEELETSKEEMQSLNEELQTVNAELQGKVEELSRANNDMKNLLNGTDIATVFLDNELHIKRYTEQAKRVIRLIPTDVGRFIGDLVSTLRYSRLVEDAREVLRSLVFKEAEVQSEEGSRYLMRILPYRTTENVIDGLVLTFVDVTKLTVLQDTQRVLLHALDGAPTAAFGNDKDLRYIWVSGTVFGRQPHELEGSTDERALGKDGARVVSLKQQVLRTGTRARAMVRMPSDEGERIYDLNVEPARSADGETGGVVGVVTDVTELLKELSR